MCGFNFTIPACDHPTHSLRGKPLGIEMAFLADKVVNVIQVLVNLINARVRRFCVIAFHIS